jgi:hypothetical protein
MKLKYMCPLCKKEQKDARFHRGDCKINHSVGFCEVRCPECEGKFEILYEFAEEIGAFN